MLQYVTTNPGKLREARAYLGENSVAGYDYDYTEIQSPSMEEIAVHGAREATHEVGGPVIVDDAGLFIPALDGFPGPYSSYIENTLGIDRVWRLASELDDPAAEFRCVLAYCAGETATEANAIGADERDVTCFTGVVPGRLVAPRGTGGFGYDPIFEHDGRTFAEMTSEEKNAVSHRGRALEQFVEWVETQ